MTSDLTPARLHTLNRIGAEVAGIQVKEETVVDSSHNVETCWGIYTESGDLYDVWTPATDHDHAALVEAALLQTPQQETKFLGLIMEWHPDKQEWHVRIHHEVRNGQFSAYETFGCAKHPNRLIAFLLAVEAMWKERQHG